MSQSDGALFEREILGAHQALEALQRALALALLKKDRGERKQVLADVADALGELHDKATGWLAEKQIS